MTDATPITTGVSHPIQAQMARHKREAERDAEYKDEPDHPHEHLGGGRLPGSLAEGHYAPATGLDSRGRALFDHLIRPPQK